MMPQCPGNGSLQVQLYDCISDTLPQRQGPKTMYLLPIDFILLTCRPLIFRVGLYSALFITLKLQIKKGERMECFLKSTETKEWLQQHTTLSGDREDKGEKLISMLFSPPHPSRKEAEPT